MGNIVLVRIGTEVDGDPARVCPHMAQWWPLYTQLVKLKLGITLEIIQAAGAYEKSGRTHIEGVSIDWRTRLFRDSVVDDAVELAREAGAPATWMRSKRRYYKLDRQKFEDHVHSALDCPCKSGADYQIAAVKAGFNGLGFRGRGGKDYHGRPATWRDWSTGMAWMRAEIARLTGKTPSASAGAGSVTSKRVAEDGVLGPQTVRAIQNDLRNRYKASGLNGKQLTVDGVWGKQTIAALQRVIQYKAPKGWARWKISGELHSYWIKRLQWLVGMPQSQMDGVLGRQTVLAIQRKLNRGSL